MHELTLAAAVVDQALEVLARSGAARVVAVTLDFGVLSGAEPDALAFCFPHATLGTAVEGARLELRPAPLVLRCLLCGAETTRGEAELVCGACDSGAVEVIGGRDLTLVSLEVQ